MCIKEEGIKDRGFTIFLKRYVVNDSKQYKVPCVILHFFHFHGSACVWETRGKKEKEKQFMLNNGVFQVGLNNVCMLIL